MKTSIVLALCVSFMQSVATVPIRGLPTNNSEVDKLSKVLYSEIPMKPPDNHMDNDRTKDFPQQPQTKPFDQVNVMYSSNERKAIKNPNIVISEPKVDLLVANHTEIKDHQKKKDNIFKQPRSVSPSTKDELFPKFGFKIIVLVIYAVVGILFGIVLFIYFRNRVPNTAPIPEIIQDTSQRNLVLKEPHNLDISPACSIADLDPNPPPVFSFAQRSSMVKCKTKYEYLFLFGEPPTLKEEESEDSNVENPLESEGFMPSVRNVLTETEDTADLKENISNERNVSFNKEVSVNPHIVEKPIHSFEKTSRKEKCKKKKKETKIITETHSLLDSSSSRSSNNRNRTVKIRKDVPKVDKQNHKSKARLSILKKMKLLFSSRKASDSLDKSNP